ncbi:hypothetical protein AZ013_004147 [Citrobacter freundii]|nr:hypothetical protein AZ013_004147 [Citrobacter freundii]
MKPTYEELEQQVLEQAVQLAIADSVNDREQVRREHAKWSQDTFGNVDPVGH